MPPRGYVLIFVFWALLTVITPTLILWSASEKPNMDSHIVEAVEAVKEVKARRMMVYLEKNHAMNRTAPAPAPAPDPETGDAADDQR